MTNPIIISMTTFFYKKLFPSIIIGIILSAIIIIGGYAQHIVFAYLNGNTSYYLHDIYTSFPTYFQFLKENSFEYLLVGILICLPTLYVKKTRSVFYTGVLSVTLVLSLSDIILIIPDPDINRMLESIVSNIIGSPILSALNILFIRIYHEINKINTHSLIKLFFHVIYSSLSYLIIVLICYLLLFALDKPSPMTFKVKLNDEFRGVYKKLKNNTQPFSIGEKNRVSNGDFNFYGNIKKINLIKKNNNITIKLAFFENCQPDNETKIPNSSYMEFMNVDNFTINSSLFENMIIANFYSNKETSSYSISDSNINIFHYNNNTLSVFPHNEDEKLIYTLGTPSTKLFLYYPPLMNDSNENHEKITFNIKINNLDKSFNFIARRLKHSYFDKKIQCRWINIKESNGKTVNLDSSIIFGIAVIITKNNDSYFYMDSSNSDSIEMEGFSGTIHLNDIENKKINNYIKNGTVNFIQLQGVSSLILGGNNVDINKDSMLVITGGNISGYFDDNLIFYGDSSYIYLDNERLNKTLWERLDSFSAIITALGGLLLTGLIYLSRKFIKSYKKNKNLN